MAFLTSACGTRKATEPVTTLPSALNIITTGQSTADVEVELLVPGKYVSKRSRLVILPQLVVDDEVVDEFEPIVLDSKLFAKKMTRKTALTRYSDPYQAERQLLADRKHPHLIKYNTTIPVPRDMAQGHVRGVVTTDGCGSCSAIDTIPIADITAYRQLLTETPNVLMPMTSEFVIAPKVRKGQGEARLQFIVDKWDIVMELANNRQELTAMLDSLRPIVSDSLCTLTSLNIFGSASAEASFQHNVMLANNRANSAKRWLVDELSLPTPIQQIIRTGAAPEGWEPVVQAMIAAGDADSTKVRQLMIKYPGPTDDAAEYYIRRLPCWPRIRDNYLAKDRKVLYNYAWEMRNYTTDDELRRMWKLRPETFNLAELLHLAQVADDDVKAEVYEYTLQRFPDNNEAMTNLAFIYLHSGRQDKAEHLLEQIGTPEADYELGIICARRGELDRAANLLPADGDANAAIIALARGDKPEARRIMKTCTEKSERVEKVMELLK